MDLYTDASYAIAEKLTQRYSTSFDMSSRLFAADIRRHVYAIYGMVRVADEIVDTYVGDDKMAVLDQFEREVNQAIAREYSTNPIVHAFAVTAKKYGIAASLITPFFASMRMDCAPTKYNDQKYHDYIYGSAEVVGLMCLRVFCGGEEARYAELMPGARALGAAYQKVNFLRDIADDYRSRSRVYFPGISFETFSEQDKQAIITDIRHDFTEALPAIKALPRSCQAAVMTSYAYYHELLQRLDEVDVKQLLAHRIRIGDSRKLWLLARAAIKGGAI